MSLNTELSRIQYLANGATTIFAFPYLFYDNAHIIVVQTIAGVDAVKVLGADYTLAGAGSPSGGSVTFLVAPVNASVVTIYRLVPFTQTADFVNNDKFPSDVNERSFDLAVMGEQQLKDAVSRSLVAPVTDPLTVVLTLPSAAMRAGQALVFDSLGNAAASNQFGTWRGNWATATAYNARDIFRDTATNNLYIVLTNHTSTTIAADFAANRIALVIDATVDAFDTNQVATASGTNTYTAAFVPVLTSLVDKMQILITFTNANTTACTLDVGTGAKAILDNAAAALTSGQIKAGMTIPLVYNAGLNSWKFTAATSVSVTPGDATVTAAKLAEATQKLLFNYGVATRSAGSPEPYALTLSPAITAYTDGMLVRFVPSANNAVAAPTLNVNALGAITLAKYSREGTNAVVNLAIGDLSTALDHIAQYDAVTTKFIVLNPAIKEVMPYIKVTDRKATTVAGGGSVSATWITGRTLNQKPTDTHSLGTLASNQLTIPAGTWRYRLLCPGFNCGVHRARLFNVTDSAVVVGDEEGMSSACDNSQNFAEATGVFTITASKAFRADHYTGSAVATNGLGKAVSDGSPETFTTLIMEQLKP